MSAVASGPAPVDGTTGVAPALAAARARLGLIAALFGLAAIAWWSTADRMDGMDAGPGTALGALGWFLGVWLVMMAAMMLPSVAPTVALYARMVRSRTPRRAVRVHRRLPRDVDRRGTRRVRRSSSSARSVLGGELAWDGAGRWLAGGTLVAAAAYELAPFKDVCLAKCRSPLGFLLGAWRPGAWGAAVMGARHGAWCVGCCWALMASLFALGVMSLAWMAFVAGLIAVEKLLPFGRGVTYATAGVLLVVGIALIAAPDAIPGLTVPGDGGMSGMDAAPAMPMR